MRLASQGDRRDILLEQVRTLRVIAVVTLVTAVLTLAAIPAFGLD